MVYPMICRVLTIQRWVTYCQWIGLREILPETPITFMGKTTVSGSDFPVNQSIEFLGDDKKKRLMDVKIWESSHV